MAFLIIRSAVRIIFRRKMAAGRARVGGTAVSILVDVETMKAGLETRDCGFHMNASIHRHKRCSAHHGASFRRRELDHRCAIHLLHAGHSRRIRLKIDAVFAFGAARQNHEACQKQHKRGML